MLTRVATYAANNLFVSRMLTTQKLMNQYSQQVATGELSDNYSGLGGGQKVSSLINMENQITINDKYRETNTLASVNLSQMSSAIEALETSIDNVKSMITSFSSKSLDTIDPDYTGEEITFNSTIDQYDGSTLTVNGTQYILTKTPGVATLLPNQVEVDISGITFGTDTCISQMIASIQGALSANDANYDDYMFSDNTITVTEHAIDGVSSILDLEGVETEEATYITDETRTAIEELQIQAFAALKDVEYYLNLKIDGKYLFSGGSQSTAPITIPFNNLDDFQEYYDGLYVTYPETTSANTCSLAYDGVDTGDIVFERMDITQTNPFNDNEYYEADDARIAASNFNAFVTPAITGGSLTTGELKFDSALNTVTASNIGAFDGLKAGDTIVLHEDSSAIIPAPATPILENGAGNNFTGTYVIKSVSEDGRKVVFEETTPLPAGDLTITNGLGAEIGTTFPIGSTISLSDIDPKLNGTYTVNGYTSSTPYNGPELLVKAPENTADALPIPPALSTPIVATYPATLDWSISANSYYNGDDMVVSQQVNETRSIELSINGLDPAFEKAVRGLAMIAQGNLVDERDPTSTSTLSKVNFTKTEEIITTALNLIDDALSHDPVNNTNEGKSDFNSLILKMKMDQELVERSIDEQETMSNYLQTQCDNIENVDPLVAATNLNAASIALDTSYAVLAKISDMSLLNYL